MISSDAEDRPLQIAQQIMTILGCWARTL